MGDEKALRYNEGKLKWSLVDMKSLEPMVRVLMYGANKYAPHNWKRGLKLTEIYESNQRHWNALMSGEDNDPESGLSHIGHILCNAMFASHMLRHKPEFDDREVNSIVERLDKGLEGIMIPEMLNLSEEAKVQNRSCTCSAFSTVCTCKTEHW